MSDTPAGWYPDPSQPGMRRYWDGKAWTEHTAAGETGSTQPMGSASYASAGGTTPMGGAPTAGRQVDTWTWQSILVTMFCCQLLGPFAVLNAGKAEAAQMAGDHVAAAEYARQAKRWTLWALGGVALIVVGYIAFFALVIGSAGFDSLQ